ncbi:MAG: hypothetical protein SGPRY_002480, partial [Prymnesium sp.]
MHWHAQRVGDLSFSADGSDLYSVGREGVFVRWQLHSAQRSFLPRLGAPVGILSTSPDGQSAALGGDDNAIRLIDLVGNSLRFTLHAPLSAARLTPDPRLRCVVELACLSSDGCHLASLERREEAELRQHICLKFWHLSTGSFRLVARVSQPHASVVSALAFHPGRLMVASASFDSKFKLWEATASDDEQPKPPS